MSPTRRDFLKTLGGVALCALPPKAWPEHAGAGGTSPQSDWCSVGDQGQPLFVPGDRGFLGRLVLDDDTLMLRAAVLKPGDNVPTGLSRGYVATFRGREYLNPTLVLHPGQRVRVELANAIGEATIVHWHGLTVDTRNDGGGTVLAAPGERYTYRFDVRNRGALYWYHPHPHGLTAGQAYRGMFGLLEIADADEEKLRAALDLTPSKSEIPLVLQDRRADAGYAATDADRMHGFLGDSVFVNGRACPYLDVSTRIYRFRVLNASNGRTYRLGWRAAAGKPVPFTLIGNDGGLLPAPQACDEAFLASAERLDLLLDLSELAVGDAVFLDTRAFDPMHMEMAGGAVAVDHAAMGHAAVAPDPRAEHAAHGGSFPEGAARTILQLRVREKIAYTARVPTRLSSPTLHQSL
jgi:blue copper oxidase